MNFKYIKYFITLISCTLYLALYGHNTPKRIANSGFIANKGQWLNPARYLINIGGAQVFAEQHALQYFFENPEDVNQYFSHELNPHLFKAQTIRQHAVRVVFNQASTNTSITGLKQYPHYYNFFNGNNTSLWKSEVPVYEQIHYKNLYDGIDMQVYAGEESGLKYDLIVSPNTSTQVISLTYQGADDVDVKKGNLVIKTSVNTFTELKPYAYQIIDGRKVEVACAFSLKKNTIKFALGEYNTKYTLIIDPLLVFSTYSGSSVDNFGHTATYDNAGNLYAAGIARNATTFPNGKYPVTTGAFQTIWGGGGTNTQSWPLQDFPCDIAISKYNNDGTQLLYATYLGGNKNEYPISLVVDKNEQLIVLGATLSANFPTKAGCVQTTKSDSFDITVTRFTSNGAALVGSTFLGGNGIDGINIADTLRMNYADEFRGEVQVSANGDVWLVSSTTSTNMAVTAGAVQTNLGGQQDGIIFKLDSALTQLKACSYLGDNRQDALYSLDIFTNGDIVVAGGTQSTNMSTTFGAFSPLYHGGISDGFVAKLNSTLTAIVGQRYWGSINYDQAHFVKLDNNQNVVVMGQTYDSVYATPGVYRQANGTLFITKFSPTLANVILSTQIGQGGAHNAIAPSAFMIDVCGRIYGSVWGGTVNYYSRYRTLNPTGFVSNMANMPITPGAYKSASDGDDFYLFVLSANADSLTYATFFGEQGGSDHVDGGTSRFDKRGIIYQSVCASCAYGTSGAFPTTAASYSPTNKSPRCSNASFKFDFRQNNVLTADFAISPRNGCGNKRIQFTNNSNNNTKQYWYINNVLKDSSVHLTDSFTTIGTYAVKLVVINNNACNAIDSITKTFVISSSNSAKFTVIQDSCGPPIFLSGTVTNGNNLPVKYLWQFGDGDTSTISLTPTYQYDASGVYTIKLIANPGDVCADTAQKTINYSNAGKNLVANFTPLDSQLCEPAWLQFRNASSHGQVFKWYINNTLKSQSINGFDSIADKGIYTVKLVVIDSTTCQRTDSIQRNYRVFKELYPLFDAVIDSCVLGAQFINQTINPNNDSVPHYWSFGDGTHAYVKNPFHQYTDTGWYDVSLVLNKGLNCEATFNKRIRIDVNQRALAAQFTLLPNPLCAPTLYQTNNYSINANKWYWLVNGIVKDSTNLNYTDSAKQAGNMMLSLIVVNLNTCKVRDTLTKNLTVYEGALPAFEIKRDSCSANIIITNTSNQVGLGATFLWDFGDGQTSTDFNPTHQYTLDSTYLITLISNAGTPCADTASKNVMYRVDAHLLKADFSVTDSFICAPAFFKATANNTNGKKLNWYINQLLVDTGKTYQDTLKSQGNFTLTFEVIDSNTCAVQDTMSKQIVVNLAAQASFVMSRDSCSLDVFFKNTSEQTTAPFIWYFGDGDSSTENSPKHVYKQTDTYTVKLLYSQGTFCADTALNTYYIDGDSIQEIFIPNVFTPNDDGANDCFKISGVNNKCDVYKIIVYNRWGNIVYENTDGTWCWDGTSQSGTPLPQGVYYYLITLSKKNGYRVNQRGTITLIREPEK